MSRACMCRGALKRFATSVVYVCLRLCPRVCVCVTKWKHGNITWNRQSERAKYQAFIIAGDAFSYVTAFLMNGCWVRIPTLTNQFPFEQFRRVWKLKVEENLTNMAPINRKSNNFVSNFLYGGFWVFLWLIADNKKLRTFAICCFINGKAEGILWFLAEMKKLLWFLT